MSPRILIIDADRALRIWLRHHIEIIWPDGEVEEIEPDRLAARAEKLDRERLDLIVLGVDCGDGLEDPAEGFDALRNLRRRGGSPPIVVVASGGNELSAVHSIRLGAADYLPRPLLNAQRLATALRRALRPRRRAPAQRSRPTRATRRRSVDAQLNLPQYSILHKLGESARAVVYLAHSATLGRNVALKISKPIVDSSDDSEEFAREYAAISAVRDASVVDIYDYGFHDGREFIAMEYFPCGDLKTRLQQPITMAESLQYLQRICTALQVVHGAGLIHRDLKPPNVMLREDGSIVLIDFGLARNLDAVNRSTVAGVLRGSPYYMSPEQAQGQALDGRSDLYAAGVILFEMLTGSKPYLGTSAVEVMEQHVHGPRPPLPAACAALEPLLDRLMARDRDERFANAAEAVAALQAASASLQGDSAPLPAATAHGESEMPQSTSAILKADVAALVEGSESSAPAPKVALSDATLQSVSVPLIIPVSDTSERAPLDVAVGDQ